ncbi:MAG TPA: ATP-dependent DNA helicase [Terriglobales bacterium]|nr:ATP-dependent DNA helicase [Terriglobales bacterium]
MASSKIFAERQELIPDPRQQAAIEHVHGPMLVVAGAGTGKTTVLTRRIAHLVREGHARPEEILAVTYTDNAAREMRERVEIDLSSDAAQICTFHAYCNNLLIGQKKNFGVLDDKDLWIYLRKRLRDLRLEYFIRAGNLTKFLDDLLDFMRRCQDELVAPEQYSEYVQQLERGELPIPRVCKSKYAADLSEEEILGRCREIARVYSTVEGMLHEENLGTFGHMITRAYQLLQDHALLSRERNRTRLILVDEFQDANFAQLKILQKLAGEEQNIFAVGDPDQAIYRFRGASSAAFNLFQRNFPAATVISLEENRRSTTPILQCSYALISKNSANASLNGSSFAYKRAPLISARDQAALDGGEVQSRPVDIVVFGVKELESWDVVSRIRNQQKQSGCRWSDIAVLYRQHSHRDEVAIELAEQGIPFSIENMDVMDTPEVRDLFACLGAVVSDTDSASFFRVAALPQFAIDPEKLRAGIRSLPKNAQSAGVSLVLREIEGGPAVLEAVRNVREEIATSGAKTSAALQIIMRRFHFDRQSPALEAVMNFVKVWQGKILTKSGDILEFVEYLANFREAKGSICLPTNDENAVRLLTAHSAKGLEFKHVFILRASSPSFPSSYKEPLFEFPRELYDPDSAAQGDDKTLHEQEERRLFYVAMTRARDFLTIHAKQGTGKTDKTPPGFLRELLKDPSLAPWFRQSVADGFQTDLFAHAPQVHPVSRVTQWLSLPPAVNLHERLSASAVQTYETCPLQFKLDREWRIPSEAPAAMQYGASMHRVLRSYFDSVRFQRPFTEDELIEMLMADLADAGIADQYQRELYNQQGVKQLRELLEACRKSPAPDVLHTEEWFEIRIGMGVVAGRIDRIDKASGNRVLVIDYKTGKPKSQEEADDSLQLSIYALAAREKWGYEVEQLAFYNLEENSLVSTSRSEAQLQEARLKVADVAENIANGQFEAKPGFYCRFCAYKNLCPATETRTFRDPNPKRKPS